MPRTLLLVGTRKGCFLLESDGDRHEWALRGPFCEGWPVYHAVHDPSTDAIYAAAASEWHGSAVWRSPDLGETWTLSSEGLAYDPDGDRKLSKVSTLAWRTAACSPASRRPESSRAATRERRGRCSRRLPASPEATSGMTRQTSRRATSASLH